MAARFSLNGLMHPKHFFTGRVDQSDQTWRLDLAGRNQLGIARSDRLLIYVAGQPIASSRRL